MKRLRNKNLRLVLIMSRDPRPERSKSVTYCPIRKDSDRKLTLVLTTYLTLLQV